MHSCNHQVVNGPLVIFARLPLGLLRKPLILDLDSFSGRVDLTKVWWLEKKGICFQSLVEHYIVDTWSKSTTLQFLWFMDVEFGEYKV